MSDYDEKFFPPGRLMTEAEVRNEKELEEEWGKRPPTLLITQEEFPEAGEPKQATAADQARRIADDLLTTRPLTDDQAIALAQVYALLSITEALTTTQEQQA